MFSIFVAVTCYSLLLVRARSGCACTSVPFDYVNEQANDIWNRWYLLSRIFDNRKRTQKHRNSDLSVIKLSDVLECDDHLSLGVNINVICQVIIYYILYVVELCVECMCKSAQ